MDLSNLSTEDVDIMMDKLLLNRGLNHLDCLGSMKQKFDVRSKIIRVVCLKGLKYFYWVICLAVMQGTGESVTEN